MGEAMFTEVNEKSGEMLPRKGITSKNHRLPRILASIAEVE